MSIEAEIQSVVLAAVRGVAAELRAELGRRRMLPIKETPVSYRAILEAERAGELRVFRVGHASLVDEAELYEWIRRAGAARAKPQPDHRPDEVGELIEIGDRRRRASGGRRR
jgi:hypothetical protein